ncbi:hypothetical protein QDX21_08825 [Auritidibacter ignavus]|uniref:Uncharacterized protein n=1 Tax=Auritidibacter ignavus TaxID=678932 RepID=A0AAJ6AFM6_9MICC|nr:hypothetical protein [Auritidibacter ignavus]WGH92421.1 hypothetical protein QDX21_08825 [Auritidibacter ignavus]WHS29212.1 hypothetical protein QM395_05735 [Auritidibacter ignavus]
MSYWELVERADRGRRWELAANAVIFNAAWISVRAECDDRFPACIRTPRRSAQMTPATPSSMQSRAWPPDQPSPSS